MQEQMVTGELGLGQRHFRANEHADAINQFPAEIRGVSPHQVSILSGVKVQATDIIFPARPNHGFAEGQGETSLEVDSAALLGEVGNNDPASLNLRQNTVADLLVMMDAVDADRGHLAVDFDRGLNAEVVGAFELRGEAHRHEYQVGPT
jgi:hypothetical protein